MNLSAGILTAYIMRSLFFPTGLYEAAPVKEAPTTTSKYHAEGTGELTILLEEKRNIGSVAKGAQRVPFATMTLSASCDEDVTVRSMTVTHEGLGDSDDILGTYVMEGYRRQTRVTRFDGQSREAVLRFRNFVIAKCDAVRIELVADIAPDAMTAGEHSISIKSPADVQTSAKLVTLNTNPDSVTVRTTRPSQAGKITVNFLPLNRSIRYGRTTAVARMQISSDNETDHMLRNIRLTNDGSARGTDLQWLRIETRSGEELTRRLPLMDGNHVYLEFDPPVLLERNQTVLLELVAEVRGSSYETVNFTLEEDGDLYATPTRIRR